MVLELVCGVDFCCNRHCRTSPVVLESGFGATFGPNIGGKLEKSEYRIANESLSNGLVSGCTDDDLNLSNFAKALPASDHTKTVLDNGPWRLQIHTTIVEFGVQVISWGFLGTPTGDSMPSARSSNQKYNSNHCFKATTWAWGTVGLREVRCRPSNRTSRAL